MTIPARPPRSTTHPPDAPPTFTGRECVTIETHHRGACLIYEVVAPNDDGEPRMIAGILDSPEPYKTCLRTSSRLYAERYANRLADARAAWCAANEPEGL